MLKKSNQNEKEKKETERFPTKKSSDEN